MRIGLLCAAARGRRVLEHLLETRPDDELCVATFPESPGEPSFVEDIRSRAEEAGASFAKCRRLDVPRFEAWTGGRPLDLVLVVGWRYLLPLSVCERPRFGTWVFHDSLLPAYRGFAPTVWAMINGETRGGVTLFQPVEAVDAGPILDQEEVAIGPDDEVGAVMERITAACLSILDRRLPELLAGAARPQPQNEAHATWTCRRLPADDEIRWEDPTRRIHDLVRAVTRPYPGAWTWLGDRRLRLWKARPLRNPPRYVGRVPGRLVAVDMDEGVTVLTGDGALRVLEVSFDGAPAAPAARVLASTRTTLGRREAAR